MINRDGEVIWNYEYCFILIILLEGQPVGFIFCGRSLFLPSKSVYQCLCMSVYVSMCFLWLLHWTLQEQKKKKERKKCIYISVKLQKLSSIHWCDKWHSPKCVLSFKDFHDKQCLCNFWWIMCCWFFHRWYYAYKLLRNRLLS